MAADSNDFMSSIMNLNPQAGQDQPMSGSGPLLALAAKGKQALASGEVSMDDAHGVLQKLVSGGQPPKSQYDFSGGEAPGVAAAISAAPKGRLRKDTSSETDSVSKNLHDTGDLSKFFDFMRGQKEFQDSDLAAADMQRKLDMLKKQPGENNRWLKPLMALTDAQTGSHLAASFDPGPTDEDRNAMILKYQDELDKRKNEQSKTILDAYSKLKTGTEGNKGATINIGQDAGFNASGLGSVRQQSVTSNAGAAFDKDPILRTFENTGNSLDRANSIINGNTPVTGKNLQQLQQDLVNAVSTGGAATEGKVNREVIDPLAAKMNDMFLNFGKVKDLRKEVPELFAQLQSMMKQVQQDYSTAAIRRINNMKINYSKGQTQDTQDVVNSKIADLMDRWQKYQPKAPPSNGLITVRHPDGRIGHIPKEQLADAIKQGYSEAK